MSEAQATLGLRGSSRPFFIFNALVSTGSIAFLTWLLFLRQTGGSTVDLRFLPAVNATFNGLSAMCLVLGYVAIRKGARELHKYLMASAFAASALFFVCYVAYHAVHGDTKYQGTGWLRSVYFFVLITHVLLSVGVLPMALTTFYFAWRGTFQSHKRIARIALPVWLYVSATGVLIFFMLKSTL
jgi:putative membrane protein